MTVMVVTAVTAVTLQGPYGVAEGPREKWTGNKQLNLEGFANRGSTLSDDRNSSFLGSYTFPALSSRRFSTTEYQVRIEGK
jgi:hypothetical protein